MSNKLGFLFALLVAVPAVAQQQPNAIFVIVTNPGGSSSDSGSTFTGEIGVAFQRMLAPNWSIEAAVSRRSDREGFTIFDPSGNVIEQHISTIRSTPVDLAAQYRFVNASSWKPYVEAGARWINGPGDTRVLGAAGGGVVWQFSHSLALRFDGRVFFGKRPAFLDSVNGSLGLGWRF
jgi:hypothetical protein